MMSLSDDLAFWEVMVSAMFPGESLTRGEEEVEAIVRLLNGRGIDTSQLDVLDMPCGPGRHTLPFAKRGAQVTAVDLRAVQLDRLRSKIDGLDVRVIEGDIRKVALPAASFDVALNLFSSIGYFDTKEGDLDVFLRTFEALRPGGVLVVDTMSVEVLAARFEPLRFVEVGGYVLEEHIQVTDAWSRIEARRILRRDKQAQEVISAHWIYGAAELQTMLRQAGFSELEVFGGLDGAPYDHTAERLVIIATR